MRLSCQGEDIFECRIVYHVYTIVSLFILGWRYELINVVLFVRCLVWDDGRNGFVSTRLLGSYAAGAGILLWQGEANISRPHYYSVWEIYLCVYLFYRVGRIHILLHISAVQIVLSISYSSVTSVRSLIPYNQLIQIFGGLVVSLHARLLLRFSSDHYSDPFRYRSQTNFCVSVFTRFLCFCCVPISCAIRTSSLVTRTSRPRKKV